MATERSTKVRQVIRTLPDRFTFQDLCQAIGCGDDWQERERINKLILGMVQRGELNIAGQVEGRSRFYVYEKVG